MKIEIEIKDFNKGNYQGTVVLGGWRYDTLSSGKEDLILNLIYIATVMMLRKAQGKSFLKPDPVTG